MEANQGQRDVLGEIYNRHFGRVYSYVRTRVSQVADAEDIVAETFEQASRSLAGFDSSRGSVAAWLIGIARHRVARHYRRRVPASSPGSADDGVDGFVDPRPSPEEALHLSFERRRVLEALGQLPRQPREAVVLRYLVGLENAEVARTMGVSRGHVAVLVHRGLAKLRTILKELEERDD